MVRTVQTARKSTRPITRAVRLVRDYQRCLIHKDELLREFISLFSDLWARAHPHGVTGYVGIVRLIYHLPGGRREWAIPLAPYFITRAYPTFDLVGDALSFFAAVHTACIRFDHVPPPATYMPFDAPVEDLPPWIFPGRRDQVKYEGESSCSPTLKKARTETQTTEMRQLQLDPTSEETHAGEAARKGKEPMLEEDFEDLEDSEEDSEQEEDLEIAEQEEDREIAELAEDLEMIEPRRRPQHRSVHPPPRWDHRRRYPHPLLSLDLGTSHPFTQRTGFSTRSYAIAGRIPLTPRLSFHDYRWHQRPLSGSS